MWGFVLFFRPELPIYNLQNHTHGRLFKMLKSDSLIKSQSVIQYALIKTHLRHYAVIRGLPQCFSNMSQEAVSRQGLRWVCSMMSHLVEKQFRSAFRPRRWCSAISVQGELIVYIYLWYIINELGDRALGFNRTLRLDPIISICC
jgi:hypothetical protein